MLQEVQIQVCVCISVRAWVHLLNCNRCSWLAEVMNADMQIDRLFDWKAQTDAPIQQSLNSQKAHVKREFDERLKQSVLNLNEQGLNVALYWQNPDKRKYVNVVPTSAITGEGLPDMLQLLVDLTQVPLATAVLCCAVLCCAVLCCAVLCCAVLRCSAVWYGVVWCVSVWFGDTALACIACTSCLQPSEVDHTCCLSSLQKLLFLCLKGKEGAFMYHKQQQQPWRLHSRSSVCCASHF